MQSSKAIDYIIAGQGLAGSCLALQLLLRKKKIIVYDVPEKNHASAVAAGLFNPFTGRIMAKTWLADILFPYLDHFYQEAETLLEQKFYFPLPLYRPFISVQEQNGWMGKSAEPNFAPYIENIFLKSTVPHVNDDFGGLVLRQSGYIDVPVFLSSVRAHLIKAGAYREEMLVDTQLEISSDKVIYSDIEAAGIIFCNGIAVTGSPLFSWLPINPLKGETITVKMPELGYILNRGVYVVPGREKDEYRVGATYDFVSSEPGTTAGGRAELEMKLSELTSHPYAVSGQNWGIRPTSLDQKIILGPHPRWRNVLIFNGLGTKGVSLAPWFSGHLAGWLLEEKEILSEVNIQRYKALYSKLL